MCEAVHEWPRTGSGPEHESPVALVEGKEPALLSFLLQYLAQCLHGQVPESVFLHRYAPCLVTSISLAINIFLNYSKIYIVHVCECACV